MKRLLFILAILVAGLLPAACKDSLQKYHRDFYLFGTVMGVTLWAGSEDHAEKAFADLQQRFQAMHRDWHAWEPGRLTAINQAFARGEAARADEEIVEMIRRSQELEQRTGGRFNPAIGALVALWGFHTSDYPILGPPPRADEIEARLAGRPSTRDIRLDGLDLRSDNPAVQLDFGGIAKGYAIDIACEMLRERGITNAVVNAGGDLKAIGSHGERPWRIAVRAPSGGVIGSLDSSRDEAIFTSGNYERFRQENEERWPHILDPRSGWPVRQLASVTVVAREGLLADAAATALTVAGLQDWEAVAGALDLDQVMLVDENGRVSMTRRMSERVELAEGIEAEIAGF